MIQGKKNLSYERRYERLAILLCDDFTATINIELT